MLLLHHYARRTHPVIHPVAAVDPGFTGTDGCHPAPVSPFTGLVRRVAARTGKAPHAANRGEPLGSSRTQATGR